MCRYHLLSVAVLLAFGLSAPTTAADAPPNVLFIAVDDLNDWTGYLDGHPDARTPNLDRLMDRGVRFTRAYCAAPACNPSRAALLTGIRPSTSGVYHNPQPWRPAMPEAVTLPAFFKQHGYRVLGCGKIFHGAFPDKDAWHQYVPRGGDPAPKRRPVNGLPNTAHFDWGPVDVPDEQMNDYKMVSWAIEQLDAEHDGPLFLACGIFRPHLPWYAPRHYFEQFPVDDVTLPKFRNDDLDDVPPMGRQMARPDGDHRRVIASNNHRKAVQGYLASIALADAQIGRLLDALDCSPHADNTIVVLWSDHGWHLGEKLHWRKFALWEEAARVVLTIRAPGVTQPEQVCERTVSLMDVYPTLADLCGLPIGDHLEGNSLRPLLTDADAPWDRPALTTHGRHNHAVRSERWRYIRYADGGEELYDHNADPYEWTNLAAKPELADVKRNLSRHFPKTNVPDAPRLRPKKKR